MDEKYNNDTQSVYSECLYSERTHKRKPEILSKGIRLIGELVKHTVQFHLLSNEEFLLTKQARRVNSRSKQRVCVGCAMRSHVTCLNEITEVKQHYEGTRIYIQNGSDPRHRQKDLALRLVVQSVQDLPYIFIKLCIVLQLETSGIQITKQFPDSSSDFNLTDSLKEQVKRDFRSRGKLKNVTSSR